MAHSEDLAHGVNPGHGFMKYALIDAQGNLRTTIFPAMIAPAPRVVTGSIRKLTTVTVGDEKYVAGVDALHSSNPITMISQKRLDDETFIPVLVASALKSLGVTGTPAAIGACVTGLPAAWSEDKQKGAALGKRLRQGFAGYGRMRAIAEPLGAVYSLLLDNHGQEVGDEVLREGRIGVVDIGHYTVDAIILDQRVPDQDSLQTFEHGTSVPLKAVRRLLNNKFDRNFTLFEADQAVRSGVVRAWGDDHPLPVGWEQPFLDNSRAIRVSLEESWGSAARLDRILITGGGAELVLMVEALLTHFQKALVTPEPQMSIAIGYARLARRMMRAA